MVVTVIGRGHSGTRILSEIFRKTGIYMGEHINSSGDLIPPDKMYQACRIFGNYVKYVGNFEWDFTYLNKCKIPNEFIVLIEEYLNDILTSNNLNKGWKIPETTLIYPWIIRLYPDVKYVYLIRNPYDNILKRHVTDYLSEFNINAEKSNDEMFNRAMSWLYQKKIVENTPKPQYFYEMRFENLVLNPEKEIEKLSEFLKIILNTFEPNKNAVNRFQKYNMDSYDFLEDSMEKMGYK